MFEIYSTKVCFSDVSLNEWYVITYPLCVPSFCVFPWETDFWVEVLYFVRMLIYSPIGLIFHRFLNLSVKIFLLSVYRSLCTFLRVVIISSLFTFNLVTLGWCVGDLTDFNFSGCYGSQRFYTSLILRVINDHPQISSGYWNLFSNHSRVLHFVGEWCIGS